MPADSTSLQPRVVARQSSEPRARPGFIWINPTGGASGNNIERYIYNDDTEAWELDLSVGPDTPTHSVDGSLWQDTNSSPPETRVYEAGTSTWGTVGVNDHAELSNVQSDQHHAKPSVTPAGSITTTLNRDGSNTLAADATKQVDAPKAWVKEIIVSDLSNNSTGFTQRFALLINGTEVDTISVNPNVTLSGERTLSAGPTFADTVSVRNNDSDSSFDYQSIDVVYAFR